MRYHDAGSTAKGHPLKRETIVMIWAAGAVLGFVIYVVGADRFLDAVFDFYDMIDVMIRNLLLMMGAQAYSLIRAMVIAFYLVFSVLAFLSAQRRLGGIGSWVGLTIVTLLLVWRPYDAPAPLTHWAVSLVLVLAGAVTLTQRLTGAGRGANGAVHPQAAKGNDAP